MGDSRDVDEAWPEDTEPAEAVRAQAELILDVAPSTCVLDEGGDAQVMVSVRVPECDSRTPTDICCVVDISGSMGTLATYECDGEVKSDGLTILDVVKHAVKTVMHILKEGDRLALVAFDDRAETALALEAMTEEGREKGIAALGTLEPRGQTNIWGGILAGMEALRTTDLSAAEVRQQTLLLLTDGQPNISPPRGHIQELKDYKESHSELRFQLNTFGFGYSLDSELLVDLATEGHGTYAFVPDAVLLGTVFVNTVANVLSTRTQNAALHLTTVGGAEFAGPVFGDYPVTEASWGRVVSLGPLQFGQSREVVVPMKIPAGTAPYLEAIVTHPRKGGGEHRFSAQASSRRPPTQDAVVAVIRAEVVSVCYEAVRGAVAGRGKAAQESVQALGSRLSESHALADAGLAALRSDVEGRMSKALKGKERFNRWGKHYLRALARAHQVQQCTNFMDPGVQVYGGRLFRALREEGDGVFLGLPPPRPSKAPMRPATPQAAALPSRPASAATASPPRPSQPAPTLPPRQRTPSPDMRTYYGGQGGG